MLTVTFSIQGMTETIAQEICTWQYEMPYAIYNMDTDGSFQELLEEQYFSAHIIPANILAGFYCFGNGAQLLAGQNLGVYHDDALDIGLGLHPELTGNGFGLPFLLAGLDFAMDRYAPKTYRLTVAAFNQRAITVYRRAGFKEQTSFFRHNTFGSMEFVVMTR